MKTYDVAVIGAGVCGMTVAHAVLDAGGTVALLDKARRPGGRLSSYRLGENLLNSAADSFHSEDDGVVAEARRRTGTTISGQGTGAQTFAVSAGEVAVRWSRGLAPRTTLVTHLEPSGVDGLVRVSTEVTDSAVSARSVVVTMPLPQAVRMLGAGGLAVPDELTAAAYERCIVLLCEVDHAQPEAGNGFFSVTRWQDRGHSTTVELFATADWSAAAWNDDVTITHAALLIEFGRAYPGARVRRSAVKRWRYSRRMTTGPQATFARLDAHPSVLLAGDGFGEGDPLLGVSRAVRSGLDVGAAVAGH